MRKNTVKTRQYRTTKCRKCRKTYEAALRLRGEGLVNNGICADCLRSIPARTAKCPVCPNRFKIQAGHIRHTCCRTCQRVVTLRKQAEKGGPEAAELLAEADRLAAGKREAYEKAEQQRREEINARREIEREQNMNRRQIEGELERERRADTRRNEKVTQAIATSPGGRLEKLAKAGKVARKTR